jgi:hypothetical protein
LREAIASSSLRSARYAAKKITRQIFASSPGWNWNEPKLTHSFAPLMVCPNGVIGKRSNPTPTKPKTYL